MKRGYTLLELTVSMAILAVIVPVALRLMFTADRALGPGEAQATATGGQAQLLEDLARDTNSASSVSVKDGWLTVSSAGLRIVYSWVPQQGATVRTVMTPGGETRAYPGVRASFAIQGRLVRAEVQGSAGGLKTAFAMRNL
jgi:prepilin-type N-terminal cleavage/methylation domain-containing protein